MVPSPGGMLSHYRLIEKIGEGGMGVVWSADDTVLGRQVAIKFLPDDFAQDAERLARFKQEARLLAALNHTNIAAIYGLEESEGARYLVLELVPGATLAERIEDGPLPIDEALNICRQIAEGLEAAHEKGILHRDLKPGNVKVTPDGVVKVLDFGLAKSFGPESPASDLTRSPTITALGTVQGVILGTAAYMSPEQARGKAVDRRTDAWAFGCVLYELLTGRHAFQGETVSDTIAKILEREPDLDALPRATPARVRDLLRRCMTKDLKQRLQAIGEARIAIEEALASPPDSGAAGERSGGVDRWNRPRSVLAYVAVALIAGLLSGIGVSWLRRDRPAGGDDRSQGGSQHGRFSINLPPGQSLSSNSPVIALSPDGSRLAYVSNEGGTLRPYLRSIDSFEAIPIRGGEGGESPFFSPDGRQIGLFKDDKLQRIDLGGGPPVVLADAQWGHGAWGPDGTIVYTPSYATGLWRIAAAGGVPEELTTVDPSGGLLGHWWPDILPNGTAVLFTSFKTPAERSSIAVLSLANRETKILLEGGFFARYVPTGHILYTDGESLMAVPFDAERLEITGPAVPVVPDVAVNPSQGAAQFSISGEGTLVYVPASIMRVARELVWVDRDGQSSPVTGRRHPYADVKLSPDGKRIAVELPGDVWIHDIGRDTLARLTFEEGDQSNPLWTPDGRQIVFQSENPIFDLFWKRSDGSGRSDPLLINRNDKNPSSFSPDGTLLAYSQTTPDLLDDIMVLPLEGDREPLSFLRTRFSEGSPAFSPDGRFLAYQSDESGRVEVYVQSYPAGEGKWQISTDGGTSPLWARDGDELFYRNGRKMMAVNVRTEGGFSAGSRRLLFEGDYEHFERRTAYDISPDGQRFLMIRTPPESAPRQINVVLNWFEELKRLVPTGAH